MSGQTRGGGEQGAILYTRSGCAPCFAMQRAAGHAARRTGMPLRVVDVDADPEIARRYGAEVPVLLLPGGDAWRGAISSAAIAAAFRAVALESPRAGGRRTIIDRLRAGAASAVAGWQQRWRSRT